MPRPLAFLFKSVYPFSRQHRLYTFTRRPPFKSRNINASSISVGSIVCGKGGRDQQNLLGRDLYPGGGWNHLPRLTRKFPLHLNGRGRNRIGKQFQPKRDHPPRQQKYTMVEMAQGDVLFAATGVTDGNMLDGVKFGRGEISTHTVVMRSSSGTVREIKARHQDIAKFS